MAAFRRGLLMLLLAAVSTASAAPRCESLFFDFDTVLTELATLYNEIRAIPHSEASRRLSAYEAFKEKFAEVSREAGRDLRGELMARTEDLLRGPRPKGAEQRRTEEKRKIVGKWGHKERVDLDFGFWMRTFDFVEGTTVAYPKDNRIVLLDLISNTEVAEVAADGVKPGSLVRRLEHEKDAFFVTLTEAQSIRLMKIARDGTVLLHAENLVPSSSTGSHTLEVSPDGRHTAVLTEKGYVFLRTSDLKVLMKYETPPGKLNHDQVQFSSDGRYALLSDVYRSASRVLIDVDKGEVMKWKNPLRNVLFGRDQWRWLEATFIPGKNALLVLDLNLKFYEYDIASRALKPIDLGYEAYKFRISPDGENVLLSLMRVNGFELVHRATGKSIFLSLEGERVEFFGASKDNRWIGILGTDYENGAAARHYIQIVDTKTGAIEKSEHTPLSLPEIRRYSGETFHLRGHINEEGTLLLQRSRDTNPSDILTIH